MPIDLKGIVKKTYYSIDDLCADFDWFIHNCLIKHRSDRTIVKAANDIPTIIKGEIKKIVSCRQCYENAYNSDESMSMLCAPPHLLLWVDCGRYGYWPAKLMHFEDEDHLTVRYFGDLTESTVKSTSCLMISRVIPENNHGTGAGTDLFDEAMQVSGIDNYVLNVIVDVIFEFFLQHCSKYIENFERKYGALSTAAGTLFTQRDYEAYLGRFDEDKSKCENGPGSGKIDDNLQPKSDDKTLHLGNDKTPPQTLSSVHQKNHLEEPNQFVDESSNSSIESPTYSHIGISPIKGSTMSDKRKISSPLNNADHVSSKLQKTNVRSDEGESASGADLCDILEQKVKNEVSESFATLKYDIVVKENYIIRLRNDLQTMADEKKRLGEQFAAEKERLEREISDLRENAQKKTCVQCKKDMDQPTFCSSECLK